jgi:hypothetical protein
VTIEIEKLMDLAKTMSVLANQKRALKEEYNQSLVFFYSGSSFKITKELISFIHTIRTVSNYNEFVLIDDAGIPVRIENLEKFLQDIIDVYMKTTYSFLVNYQKLKNSKNVESILDL